MRNNEESEDVCNVVEKYKNRSHGRIFLVLGQNVSSHRYKRITSRIRWSRREKRLVSNDVWMSKAFTALSSTVPRANSTERGP